MKISNAFNKAINEHLWDGVGDYERSALRKQQFSCLALERPFGVQWDLPRNILDGLINMGLEPSSTEAFHDIEPGTKRQYARALWLTWAALMAKEQGL